METYFWALRSYFEYCCFDQDDEGLVISRETPLSPLGVETAQSFLPTLDKWRGGLRNSTKRTYFYAVQSYFMFKGLYREIRSAILDKRIQLGSPKRKKIEEMKNVYSIEEMKKLSSSDDLRINAMVLTQYQLALRVSELVGIDVDGVDFEAGTIAFFPVKVRGEDVKLVVMKADPTVMEAIQKWIKVREAPPERKALFLNNVKTRMTPHNFREYLKRIGEKVGVKYKGSHAMRHAMGKHMGELASDGKCSDTDVMKRMRHKNIGTTLIYLHKDEEKVMMREDMYEGFLDDKKDSTEEEKRMIDGINKQYGETIINIKDGEIVGSEHTLREMKKYLKDEIMGDEDGSKRN
ncbi:MAG: tyrosine-type recombinase/integrase [Candidatus Hodarchaeales archaeon]